MSPSPLFSIILLTETLPLFPSKHVWGYKYWFLVGVQPKLSRLYGVESTRPKRPEQKATFWSNETKIGNQKLIPLNPLPLFGTINFPSSKHPNKLVVFFVGWNRKWAQIEVLLSLTSKLPILLLNLTNILKLIDFVEKYLENFEKSQNFFWVNVFFKPITIDLVHFYDIKTAENVQKPPYGVRITDHTIKEVGPTQWASISQLYVYLKSRKSGL
jgi:hypothetical protein